MQRCCSPDSAPFISLWGGQNSGERNCKALSVCFFKNFFYDLLRPGSCLSLPGSPGHRELPSGSAVSTGGGLPRLMMIMLGLASRSRRWKRSNCNKKMKGRGSRKGMNDENVGQRRGGHDGSYIKTRLLLFVESYRG